MSPAFSASIHDYTLQVSVLCQSLQLMASVPAEASLVINGTPSREGVPWKSALLAVGRTAVNLNLTTQFGGTASYKLVVDRVGSQQHYIKASNSDAQDVFGLALASDGDTLVTGSPWEDSASAMNPSSNALVESGAAYVFVSENGTWTEQALLKANAPTSLEYFGTSVAISGDTFVVGAPSSDPLGVTTLPTMGKGAIYVFVRSDGVWKQQAKLAPRAGPSDDFFGISVAVQGDTILVGAPFDNDGGSHSGAIYEFTRNADMWSEGQKIKAMTPIEGALFGLSLAMDGDNFLTGAALDSSGAATAGSAYVFVRDGGAWQEQQRLQMAAPAARATFGWKVALLGDTAVVGAPRVELVRDSAPSGEAYVFERSAGRWTQSQVLTAAYPRASDTFGSGLALSQSTLVLGGNGDASGSRGAAGEPIRSDAPRSGATVVYAKQGGKWVPTAFLKADNAEAGDIFGEAVVLTDDGLVIAAPFEASAAKGIDGDQSSNSAPRSGALYSYR